MKPKLGVFQSDIINPNICNLVLDGIDESLLKLKRSGKLPLGSFLK